MDNKIQRNALVLLPQKEGRILKLPINCFMAMTITRGLEIHFNNLLQHYTEEEIKNYVKERLCLK